MQDDSGLDRLRLGQSHRVESDCRCSGRDAEVGRSERHERRELERRHHREGGLERRRRAERAQNGRHGGDLGERGDEREQHEPRGATPDGEDGCERQDGNYRQRGGKRRGEQQTAESGDAGRLDRAEAPHDPAAGSTRQRFEEEDCTHDVPEVSGREGVDQ